MQSSEELITRVLHHLTDKFKNKLILKGGILFRLYNSPRATQDIDFVLISQESKKKLKSSLVKAVEELENVTLEKVELNSRGIFLDIVEKDSQVRCLIEINVLPATHLPPEPLSTAPLAQKYALAARIISAMSLTESFAHKIAAALEREATRDLYDLSLMEAMGPFDGATLDDRLSRLSIKRAKPRTITFRQAAQLLRARLNALTTKKLEAELYPLLPPEYRPGVLRILQASVGRLIQRLENMK